MSTFVKLLPLELTALTEEELIEPQQKVTKRDRVVGEMDDELKRLWTLFQQYSKKSDIARVEAEYGGNTGEAQSLAMRTHAVEAIFWIAVHDKFELWEKPSVGVRAGWKVVWHEGVNGIRALFQILGDQE